MNWRPIWLVLALALCLGLRCVFEDAVGRIKEFQVWSDALDDRKPQPSPQATRKAMASVTYLMGIIVGLGSGVGSLAAYFLWRRVFEPPRPRDADAPYDDDLPESTQPEGSLVDSASGGAEGPTHVDNR